MRFPVRLDPLPRFGCLRHVRRFAWWPTPIHFGALAPVEGHVWMEWYWQGQVQYTDDSWRDGYSALFLDDPRVPGATS